MELIDVGEVTVSIEIRASIDDVFDLVSNLQGVMDLMPSGWEVEVTKLNEGEVGKGTRHRVKARKGRMSIDYVDQIEGFVENQEVLSQSIEGFKFRLLRWNLESLNGKTRLTRRAEYAMPYSIIGRLLDRLWAQNALKKKGEAWLRNIRSHLEEPKP